MRSRALILASLAALAAVVLVVGVALAGPTQSGPLPQLEAPELLAQMAQADGSVSSLSGDIAWRNELFGDLSSAPDMAQLPAQSPLTGSGSGRIWVSDAGLRAESQGSGGDQIVVVNKAARTAWIYDYAQNTAKKYVAKGEASAEAPSPAPSAAFMTPEAITGYLQQFARFATVEVAGQTDVAGRDTYLLRMTPVADDTALGYVQAAIDGETMTPLRLEVFAKGGSSAVLQFGFESVSYDTIDGERFEFTPPDGTTVTAKTIDTDEMHESADAAHGERAAKDEPTKAEKAAREKLARRALLTRGQVQKLVPYELVWARGSEARAFRWGYVMDEGGPLTAAGTPLAQLMGMTGAGEKGVVPKDARTQVAGPSSMLLYGDGFGAIVLAQTQTTPDLEKQLKQLRQASAVLEKASIGGVDAQAIGTPLGGIVVWQHGKTTLAAAGMVPMDDLKAFASSVR